MNLSDQIEKKKVKSNIYEWPPSYFWRYFQSGENQSQWYLRYSSDEYDNSFIRQSGLIGNSIFQVLFTWKIKPLSQEKIISALGGKKHLSIVSSISGTLAAGVRSGLYEKAGKGKSAVYSLSEKFRKSKALKSISFIPSEQAILCAQKRARGYARPRPNKGN